MSYSQAPQTQTDSENDTNDPEPVSHGLAKSLDQQARSKLSPASSCSRSGSASSLPLLVTAIPAAAAAPNPPRGRERHSIWECETTPMTTRPHFDRYDINIGNGSGSSIRNISPTRPIRRIRSRSLGSSDVERREHWQRLEQGHLLLPLMDWDVYDLRASAAARTSWRAKSDRTVQLSLSQQAPMQQAAASVDETTPMLLHKQQPSLLDQQESSPTINHVSFPDAMHIHQNAEQNEQIVRKDGMDSTKQRGPEEEIAPRDLPPCVTVMYGMINAIIVLPVLMSFGSIIYRDDAFAPYIPVLIKLTLVSGIVHQLCFSTFSSLPFAVGQVQDAGLIFLSSMASDMVRSCQLQHHDDAVMLATVTVGLALATALLGCGLVMIGYLNLGQYVQLLPTCVVGGYLAYIGWFCGEAGVGIMAGSSDLTIEAVSNNLPFILPGVLGGVIIYLTVRKVNHVAALPLGILLELLLFYLILWLTGTTVEEATSAGWIRRMEQPPPWYDTWSFLRISLVDWSVLPQLLLTELGMIFVVALSSCLDVAAIEIELNRPLNYNHELKTVGLSNIISGATGGYTGSYIFSQSIFSLRAGIRSRLNGYTIALCQVLVVVSPFPVLMFVPNAFFGSLLVMICVDLMYEWLWDVRRKLTTTEYGICLSTFVLIQCLSVEYGILVGVALYLVLKKAGCDVGVAKFSTHDENTITADDQNTIGDDLLLVEEMHENQHQRLHEIS